MTTKEAVELILEANQYSKYRLAQIMGCAPTLVDFWLRKTKMGEQYKSKFEDLFGIKIDDTICPSNTTS